MTLYYAMGGGLGHLTRSRVLLQNLSIKDYKVVTACDYATMVFPREELIIVPPEIRQNSRRYQEWISKLLNRRMYQHLIIDTFINGIMGELTRESCSHFKFVTYATRRLKWENYKAKFSAMPLSRAILLESLQPDHLETIRQNCNDLSSFSLQYPTYSLPISWRNHLASIGKPVWLIMHSQPHDELDQLVQYAGEIARLQEVDPYFLVISLCQYQLNQTGKVVNYFPGWSFYQNAAAIFTGGGYNSVYQPHQPKIPHFFLPFPRKYDDQFWRLSQLKLS
ncbi:MAG: hypothetical protein ACNS62_04630 [Candidatus Cyclobacteriaceae bacterium M3_2C_046]